MDATKHEVERKLDELLSSMPLEQQEWLLQYALDHVIPKMRGIKDYAKWKLHTSVFSCGLKRYINQKQYEANPKIQKWYEPFTPATCSKKAVLVVEKEPGYWYRGHFYEGSKPYINPLSVLSLPIGTELFTKD